jgi:hypothetical protein
MPDPWRIHRDGGKFALTIPGYGSAWSYHFEIDPVTEAYKMREAGDCPVTLVVVTDLQRRLAEVLGFAARMGE